VIIRFVGTMNHNIIPVPTVYNQINNRSYRYVAEIKFKLQSRRLPDVHGRVVINSVPITIRESYDHQIMAINCLNSKVAEISLNNNMTIISTGIKVIGCAPRYNYRMPLFI
jgi:patatin-like phospholipase/acyl hydrolase